LRPVIGKSIVVPHIKRVRIIGEVVIMVDGMLRHFLPFIVRFVVEKEELLSVVVDIPGGKKGGLAEERLGSPSVTPDSHRWCTFQVR